MVRRVLLHPVFRNAVALYGVQFANLILPLATVPYLARVLGPGEWGLVIFAQSLASWLSIVLQYGFRLSATREIAQHRDDAEQVRRIASGVMGAQICLVLVTTPILVAVYFAIATFHARPWLLAAAWAYSVALGLNPFWFFQGMEQMRRPALVTVLGSGLALGGIFLFINPHSSSADVLLIRTLGASTTAILNLAIVWRTMRLYVPRAREVVAALRGGLSMFLFQASVSLYTTANAFVLGLFVSPAIVGFYGSAERLSRAALGMLGPITNAIFPRISRLATTNPARAARVAGVSLIVMVVGGAALGGAIAVLAPEIVRVVLGPGYEATVPVLRLLSALLPIVGASNVLGIQWMLPLKLDNAFNKIIIAAGLVNIGLAVVLAPLYGATGMAASVVTSEALVTTMMAVVLWRRGLAPNLG